MTTIHPESPTQHPIILLAHQINSNALLRTCLGRYNFSKDSYHELIPSGLAVSRTPSSSTLPLVLHSFKPLLGRIIDQDADALREILKNPNLRYRKTWIKAAALYIKIKNIPGFENRSAAQEKLKEIITSKTVTPHEKSIWIPILIELGADLNATDEQGRTLLFDALDSGPETVKVLIDAGATVDATDNNGYTPLSHLSQFAKPFPPRSLQDAEVIKVLTDAGANPNRDIDGIPLLCVTAMSGKNHIVDALIEGGANVNAPDLAGQTPLLLAMQLGTDAIILSLVRAGAHVDVVNQDGLTPLQILMRFRSTDSIWALVDPLVQAGANIHAAAPDGLTPLGVALRSREFSTAKHIFIRQYPMTVFAAGLLATMLAVTEIALYATHWASMFTTDDEV